MEKRTYNPCDECPHGIDRRDGSGNDAMCRICEFNAYLKLGTIDHLRDLHQAEQDGRLEVLPCKVGDHILADGREAIVVWFFGYKTGRYLHVQFLDNAECADIPFYEIGKNRLSDREDAEAAMAQKGDSEQ